jgi:hypothetical protein
MSSSASFSIVDDMTHKLARAQAARNAYERTPDYMPELKQRLRESVEAHMDQWRPHLIPPSECLALSNTPPNGDAWKNEADSTLRLWIEFCLDWSDVGRAKAIVAQTERLLVHIVRAAQADQGLIDDATHHALLAEAHSRVAGGLEGGGGRALLPAHGFIHAATPPSSVSQVPLQSAFYERAPEDIWHDLQHARSAVESSSSSRAVAASLMAYPLDHTHALSSGLYPLEHTVLEQLSAPQTFTQLGRPRDRVISYVTSRLFDLRDAWYAFIDAPLDLERQSQVRVLTHQMLTLVLSLHAQ